MSRYAKTMSEALKEVSTYEIPTIQDIGMIVEDIPAELPPGGPDVPRYKNVSNATVDKADKKANKEKKKVEKEVLDPKLDEENEEVEVDEDTQKIKKDYDWLAKHRQKEREALVKAVLGSKKQQALARKQAAQKKDAKDQDKAPVGKQHEVAPPGWGHTKAEKEKTKPDKPKSKIGGSAHEFDKDLKSGKFKGLPGDKTMKDKKASMFKLMWSMKNKGDKPHYKPGEKGVKKEGATFPTGVAKKDHLDDIKKKIATTQAKDKENAKRGYKIIDRTPKGYGPNEETIPEGSGWNSTFKTASQARPRMSLKDAEKFINELGFGGTEKKKALQAAKKWLK